MVDGGRRVARSSINEPGKIEELKAPVMLSTPQHNRDAVLPEVLRERALGEPDRRLFTFLADGEVEAETFTCGELDRRARAIAAELQGRTRRGDRALLLFPPGLDFIAAFFGCLYAGVVAVPCSPPRPRRGLEGLERQAYDAEASLALTTRELYDRLAAPASAGPALGALTWLITGELPDGSASGWRAWSPAPQDLAFLQYTSGSTSAPRGVLVSHGNLLDNERQIRDAFGQSEASLVVGWLPLYHDMGLIGNVLQPLFCGGSCVLMSPSAFLQRPLRWLEAVSRYRATTSGGPSFAYELCARRGPAAAAAGLDLSSWSLAFCGAEPVRADTLERFAAAFAPLGFRSTSFYPCYGLAEATLFVSGGRCGEAPRVRAWSARGLAQGDGRPAAPGEEGRELVSCGGAFGQTHIAVVDPASAAPCPPGRIGEVWIAGPSVAGGYWGRAEESGETFGARLAGSAEGPFLRTGDLAFLAGGELYITGRRKDLIIVRGSNHYPQDLELSAERSHPLLRPGCGAAFPVDEGGEERLVIVQEVDRRATTEDLTAALAAIRGAIAEEHELLPAAVVLIAAGTLPKTSSGKVQRGRCRALFEAGELEVVAEQRAAATAPGLLRQPMARPERPEDLEPWLAARLGARLGCDPAAIERDLPLAHLGVDSLAAMELLHDLEAGLGIRLPLATFLGGASLAELTDLARQALAAAPETAPDASEELGDHPLSTGQQGLLYLQQLAPESAVHNISAAARVRGALDAERLRRAFQGLADRHPALRTTFSAPGGEPVQRVHARMEVDFRRDEASGWSGEELSRRLAEEAYRPFDLATGPLLRVRLFAQAGDDHTLLLTVHHIVADFWSLAVIARELGALYAAGGEAGAADLPPLPARPADHARDEAASLAGPAGERLWEHWRGQLGGDLPALALPLDRPRPPASSGHGSERRARLGRATADALRGLSRESGATLFAGLLAAFDAFLWRYTGQSDLVVGSPVAGRTRAELTGLVGYFVNLLPLRADLTGDPSFAELVGRARGTALAALAHQEYPLARLVERLQPVREPGCPPLFQTVLVLQKAPPPAPEDLALFALGEPGGEIEIGGLALESVALERRSAEFDLTLTVAEAAGELVLCLQYNTALFDGSTVERMLESFSCLLAAAVASQRAPVAELPLLGVAERRQLLAGWAEAVPEIPEKPEESLLHRAFEVQAARRPAAPALTLEGESLTYSELSHRADCLARQLRVMGVGPEIVVGLCAERSFAMVVGLLGILKAGGAYLPLDPKLPRERLRMLLEDVRSPVLVAHRAVADTVEGLVAELPPPGARLLYLDDLDAAAAGRLSRLEMPEMSDACTAYVIYTSGSTGRPKGVMIPHRQVARLFSATRPWFSFGPDDVWTLFHSFAFDFSVWEIWGALLHGGRLVIVPHAVSRTPDAFRHLLLDEGVTVLNQTPSAFRQLTAADAAAPTGDAGRLRCIVFGGEALEPHSLAPWFDRHGDRLPRLVNMYGITETTVHVTYRPMAAADLDRPGSPVGVPIPDLRVWLLDARGGLAPIGVPGEIHVGGEGLARGYLRRPGQTAQRFVPDPFSRRPGARLYASGDLARRLPDGSLQFLGRIDHQVKVRGFRIELGEIEAALRAHPGILDVAVLAQRPPAPAASPARLDSDPAAGTGAGEAGTTELRRFLKRQHTPAAAAAGESRLVAYVAVAPEGAPGVSELRRFLQEKLPEYMVPAVFVRLPALPLTANGKLDTRALPAPDGARPELGGTFVLPSGPVEEALAEVWADVLGLDRVGAEDNFFALGGDSIRSIQVRARAEACGLSFSLQELLERQTLRELAATLTFTAGGGAAEPAAARFSLVGNAADRARLPGGIDDAYPLARIQAGVIFHSQSNLEDPMYHDIFFYQLRGGFDLPLWTTAVQRLLDRHAILRTGFDLTRYSEPLQIVETRIPADVRVLDLRALSPAGRKAEQEAWIAAEKRHPFAWREAPLIRFFLHRMSDDETHLVLSFHDAILDGWSTALLLTELLRDYFGLLAGKRLPPRRPPRVSFRDFVALELATLDSDECRAFWERNLSDCIPGRLPRWSPPPRRGGTPEIGVLDVPVEAATSDALEALARHAGTPIKHVLLASHLKVMACLAGHPDVLTGLESNGRLEVEEGEQVLGIHLNSLPFRLVVPPGSWIDLIRATFAAERDLLPFRRYPLAELQKGRSGEPLFEAVFNYTHFHVFRELQGIGGLEVTGARGFGETHFTLRVEYNRDPFSNQVQLDLESDVAEIPQAQLAAIGNLFARVLAAMTEAPERSHGEPLLSPAERQQILVEWNATAAGSPREQPVHRLFEEQARRTPEAAAVTLGEASLTYRRLDARADRLARRLRAEGAAPGALVGILAERSLDFVVAILATLKAGAAYVPLDPAYPPEHLAQVIADSGLSLLLTQERVPAPLRALARRPLLLDEKPAPGDGGGDGDGLAEDGGAGLDDLAYVIYTSGSTGKPKGVAVTHRNLAHSTASRFLYYEAKVEAYLLVPSFAFDSSVAGIFWTLCGGGTLVLLAAEGVGDLKEIGAAISRNRVSHLLCIPSLWALLAVQAPPAALRSLTTVIVAGEPCPPDLPDLHRGRLPGCSLFNEYGPTEGTVWCTVHRCAERPAGRPVPIGRPIPNVRIVLLDAALQPVPFGVPGELLLGGEGVAAGYLGRPELTAERWVPDPWAEEPGERLYRTGDLARHLATGEIEFLGRRDDQVKVRGFRIEPGEIEQVLRRHPAVREAVVVARDDGRGGRQLAAYLVSGAGGDGEKPSSAALRAFAAAHLPAHMVPRWFVQLDELPRTPNGKTDRRRLPDPRQAQPPAITPEIADLLRQLETLSDAEAQAVLAVKRDNF
jgi:amino acid adenylation domain-containing protein